MLMKNIARPIPAITKDTVLKPDKLDATLSFISCSYKMIPK